MVLQFSIQKSQCHWPKWSRYRALWACSCSHLACGTSMDFNERPMQGAATSPCHMYHMIVSIIEYCSSMATMGFSPPIKLSSCLPSVPISNKAAKNLSKFRSSKLNKFQNCLQGHLLVRGKSDLQYVTNILRKLSLTHCLLPWLAVVQNLNSDFELTLPLALQYSVLWECH